MSFNHLVTRLSALTLFCSAPLLLAASAQGGTDLKINSDATGDVQNEVRISVDPTSSSNLVTAYNDKVGTSNSLGISYSTNGGASWTDTQIGGGLIHPTTFTTLDDVFDPYIEHDPSGIVYAGYVARPGTPTLPGGPESALYMEFSTDGGVNWSGPTVISADFNGSGPAYRFNDRPTMAATSTDVAVTWIKDVNLNMPTSDIYYSQSTVAPVPGLSFSLPITVNDMPGGFPGGVGQCGMGMGDCANAPDVAVAANGKVYVAWIDFDVTVPDASAGTIKIDSSATVAVPTFGADTSVITIDPLPKNVSTTAGAGRTADDARAQSYPVIAADPTDATGNTVYMAYAEDTGTSDEGNILFIKTVNGGTSWSMPLQLNDDGGSFDQMHPAIAVKADGTIDIVWYDKRNSSNDDAWDVYITRSTNGGASFASNVLITDNTFATPTDAAGSPWLGEYMGIDVDSTTAFLSFTSSVDPAGSNDSFGDVYFDSILNASIPEPNTCALVELGLLALGMLRPRRPRARFSSGDVRW